MGRGRNGVLVQTTCKGKKRLFRELHNNACTVVFKNKNAVPPVRKEDIFLDPGIVNYLRSLNPREVAQTLKS